MILRIGWALLSAPEDYAEEAAFYERVLSSACESRPRRVLELGSGGGNNAFHMKRSFELTLVDVAPRMLAVSQVADTRRSRLRSPARAFAHSEVPGDLDVFVGRRRS